MPEPARQYYRKMATTAGVIVTPTPVSDDRDAACEGKTDTTPANLDGIVTDVDVRHTHMPVSGTVASVARLLQLACGEWQYLPQWSTAVINDDSDMKRKEEVLDDCTVEELGVCAATIPVETKGFDSGGASPPQACRFPRAVVRSFDDCYASARVSRDVPTITVDGAPFDPVAHTVPSGYGDLATCSTRYDPEVRLCRELAARDGTVSP